MAEERPHFLLFPFPSPGHSIPFFHLSTHLASRGIAITFITTQAFLDSLPPDTSSPSFRFVTIPTKLAGPFPTVKSLFQSMEQHQSTLEELILSSRSSPSPICCFIANMLCPWTRSLAHKLSIPRVVFWTAGAGFLQTALLRGSKGEAEARYRLSGGPDMVEFASLAVEGIEDSTCILINSMEELENEVMETLSLNVRCVGPLLPTTDIEEPYSSCVEWLNKQEPRSVLYIAFGSLFDMPPSQLEAFMSGLEASGKPFLWVKRSGSESLPSEFLEKTEARGLIVPWVSQLQVLRHSAVGGFVTHCGWNSVVESIAMGVPMLCYPISAEQPMNAWRIANEWKVGLEMKKGKDGIVEEEEVERLITELMAEGDEDSPKRRVAALRKVAKERLQVGGTVQANLDGLVSDVTTFLLSAT